MIMATMAPFALHAQCTGTNYTYSVENETDCYLYVTVDYTNPGLGCTSSVQSDFVVDPNDDENWVTDLGPSAYVTGVRIELWDNSTMNSYGTPHASQGQCSNAENDDLENCNGPTTICVHFNSDCTAARVEPSKC